MPEQNTTVTRRRNVNPWWLVALLVAIVLGILAYVFFHTHPHVFGASSTATPRVVTSTPPPTTATPRPGPTGTPKPGPTATPKPGPTGTPKPAPTPTVYVGQLTHPQSSLTSLQGQVNSGVSQYQYYKNPVQVVQHNLPQYGFKAGQFTIKSPPAAPTPTPYAGAYKGRPEVKVVVAYRSKTYDVVVTQPVQRGPGGIWTLVSIRTCSGSSC